MAAGESRQLVSAVRSIANPNVPGPVCSSIEREQKAEQQLEICVTIELQTTRQKRSALDAGCRFTESCKQIK